MTTTTYVFMCIYIYIYEIISVHSLAKIHITLYAFFFALLLLRILYLHVVLHCTYMIKYILYFYIVEWNRRTGVFFIGFFPPGHARPEEGKCICTDTRTGKKTTTLHYIHNTCMYMRIVPRGGGAYTRPRIIQIGLVISIRRHRRITLLSCAGRGGAAAGDVHDIIRSSLSLAPTPLHPSVSVAHSSPAPAHSPSMRRPPVQYYICTYASASKYIYFMYIYYHRKSVLQPFLLHEHTHVRPCIHIYV